METPEEKDGGVASRKLWFCVGTSVAIVLASLFVPPVVFVEVVMGVITVCGIYVGGNAATKFITGRTSVQKAIAQPATSAKKSK